MTASGYIAKVVSSAFKAGYRLIKVTLLGGAREPYEAAPYGIDGNPIKDSDVVYIPTSINDIPVIVGVLNKNQKALVGELRMYATDTDGVEKVKLWLHSNGNVEIGGTSGSVNANHSVQYEALDMAVQSDIVTFINAQLLLIATGIAAGGGSYTPGTMAVTLTAAKETTILVP